MTCNTLIPKEHKMLLACTLWSNYTTYVDVLLSRGNSLMFWSPSNLVKFYLTLKLATWGMKNNSPISRWAAVSSLNNQLIHYSNQLTVVEQCFTNIAAIQNMGYYSKFEPTESMGAILLIWCKNTTMWEYGARIKIYCVLCSNTYSISSSLDITSRWFATRR